MNKSLNELLKEFEDRSNDYVSDYKQLWEGDNDELYDVDIHIWRHPGMGNSLQTIVGNPVSIYTATASYLQTLVNKEVLDIQTLKFMFEKVLENLEGSNDDK